MKDDEDDKGKAVGSLRPTQKASQPWGEASDLRGRGYTELAKAFVARFPVGTTMSAEELDKWFEEHRMLTIPPVYAPKSSDAWMGHLQRRHICRSRINKAATHPRMVDDGSSSFIIAAIGGLFEVRAPHLAVTKGELPRKIITLTKTKRKQLVYLMQSADWSVLPPSERVAAEMIFYDIEKFAKDARSDADHISFKLAQFEAKIRKAMEMGEIVAQNHGLTNLLAPPDDASDAETEDDETDDS